VLDAPRGILGLNQDSDATGVGVQVLRSDLTPMPLIEEVQMTRLQNGDIQSPWLPATSRLARTPDRRRGQCLGGVHLDLQMTRGLSQIKK
jgi:type 1 fimbria pilin